MRRRIIAGLIVAASLATAGIAYAENQPSDPSLSPTAPAAPGAKATAPKATRPKAGPAKDGAAKAGGKAGVLKGAIHGDLLVRNEDGSTRTVTFDRGKVTAISAGSITIARPDGVSVSNDLNDKTIFNGTPRDQLQPGTGAIVISEGHTALRVLSKGAAKARAKAACAAAPADGSDPAGAQAGKDRARITRPAQAAGSGPRCSTRKRWGAPSTSKSTLQRGPSIPGSTGVSAPSWRKVSRNQVDS